MPAEVIFDDQHVLVIILAISKEVVEMNKFVLVRCVKSSLQRVLLLVRDFR